MKKIKAPDIQLSITGNSVQFTADKSWNVEFIGADFTQLVDDDLKVHTPLKDTSAALSFRCKKGSTVIEKDCTLQIKGAYGAPVKKPNVIPEPAQWHPAGGMLGEISSYSYDESLKSAADLFAGDFFKVTGKTIEKADNGTVRFSIDEGLAYLGDEGYEIECEGNSITVKVSALIGAIWAGKTICQLMVQGGFPHGIMRDYPRYSVRGFMLDVGRRPVSLAMLERIVDSMAWYKMNDFQVHLSDNYIWLEDYAQNGDESTFDAYSAFRLESSLKNDKGETPASEDYSYSKAEFNNFMKVSLNKGVRITPEIDMPAHALAFTKVFPEYAVMGEVSPLMKKRPLTDHINVADPKAMEFVKSIFDEYTKGDEPVFPKGSTVHIGADEFLTDYGAYRKFLNEIIPYLKKTNPVRLWGSLSWIKDSPETPIVKEAIDGVQVNLWSEAWADGKEMYDMGFDLINTDHKFYVVPNGTKIRAPYMDYIIKRNAIKKFEPNRVFRKNSKKYYKLPAGNKQMLGGCFAIWQDNIDKRCKGITEQDLYDRFTDSAPFMAEKNWGSCTDKTSVKAVDAAALRIEKSRVTCHASFGGLKDIRLNGAADFKETGCYSLPVGARLCIKLNLDEAVPGQILAEADAPYGTYDIRIMQSGRLGFTAEGYEYEFDYKPEAGRVLDLEIDTKPLKTVLKSGLFIRKRAKGSYSFNGVLRCSNIKNTTFSIPVQRIGSKTNSVKAQIYSIYVK